MNGVCPLQEKPCQEHPIGSGLGEQGPARGACNGCSSVATALHCGQRIFTAGNGVSSKGLDGNDQGCLCPGLSGALPIEASGQQACAKALHSSAAPAYQIVRQEPRTTLCIVHSEAEERLTLLNV